MHEMSITQSIVELCEKHSNGRKVTEVVLEIGALSGLVPEAVEFCFEACAAGTIAEGARLEIVWITPQALCLDCNRESDIESYFDPCSYCGSHRISVIKGEELRIKELEVE